MKIESGTGNGKWVGVDGDNRLRVVAKSDAAQHVIASEENKTFQIWGTATLANGTVTPLTVKNTSTTQEVVVTYIRWQLLDVVDGASGAIPNASNYMQVGYDTEYVSGGTAVSEANMTAGSNNVANIQAYNNNPVMTGDEGLTNNLITVFDRHYPKAEGDMYSFNKEGAAIVLPGQSITFQYVGDKTDGTVYVRLSFYSTDIG
jgi:hypothetical protein